MNLYDLITIIPNAIPEEHINVLLELTNQESSNATIGKDDNIKLKDRNTLWYPIPENIRNNLIYAIFDFHENFLKNKYHSTVLNIEPPQLLQYPIGGHYIEHNDSEVFQNGKWERTISRDISLLCYLDDDYEGGELEFTDLNLKIKPKKGTIISFPSYKEFPHKVHPVISGIRHTIVSWIETEKKIYETLRIR
jgi:predicted 2-oxoglutarate/Fe(II)-dependent dioxygenase YbiX